MVPVCFLALALCTASSTTLTVLVSTVSIYVVVNDHALRINVMDGVQRSGLTFRPMLRCQASLDTLEVGSPRRAVFFPGTGKKNDLGEGRGK